MVEELNIQTAKKCIIYYKETNVYLTSQQKIFNQQFE